MMRVKRYQAATLTDALKLVKDSLGSEAIILGSRRVRLPGWRGWFRSPVLEVSALPESESKRLLWDALLEGPARTRPVATPAAGRAAAQVLGDDPASARVRLAAQLVTASRPPGSATSGAADLTGASTSAGIQRLEALLLEVQRELDRLKAVQAQLSRDLAMTYEGRDGRGAESSITPSPKAELPGAAGSASDAAAQGGAGPEDAR